MASPYGALQVPPLNAPPGNAPQPGVQPGADGAIVAGVVIVFGPGGAKAVIGPIPPELLAYYQTRLSTIATFAITLYPNVSSYHYEIVGTALLAPNSSVYADGIVVGTTVTEYRREECDPTTFNGINTFFNDLAVAGTQRAGWNFGFSIPSGLAGNNFFQINQADFAVGATGLPLGAVDPGSAVFNVPTNFNGFDLKYSNVSMPRGVIYMEQQTFTFTSTTTIGSEQVAFTTTNSMTWLNARGYRVTFSAQLKSTALQNPACQIRQNNLAGVSLIGGPRLPITTTGNDLPCERWGIFVNTTGATKTGKLCFTVTPQAATAVVCEGGSGSGVARIVVEDMGSTGQYSGISVA